jgi:rhodanese-related sulfurtransferase
MTPHPTRRQFAFLVPLAWLALSACAEDPIDAVSLEQARQALETGSVTVIDIREPDEHATGVAKGARLLPKSQLQARLSEIPNDPKQPVYLICATQNRSRAAVDWLHESGGYSNVKYVQGGMRGWVSKAWPTTAPATNAASKS